MISRDYFEPSGLATSMTSSHTAELWDRIPENTIDMGDGSVISLEVRFLGL